MFKIIVDIPPDALNDDTLFLSSSMKWLPVPVGASEVTHTGALTANNLIIGSGIAPNDITALGSLGTTTTVLHGNAAGAPTFGAVVLTTDVSGVLPVANGGTGDGTITANGVMIGNGLNPVNTVAVGASNTVLHGNTAAAPTFSAVDLTADVTGILPATKGGSGVNSPTAHGVLVGEGAAAFASVAVGASNTVLHGNTGADPTFSAVNLQNDVTSVLGTLNGGTGVAQPLAHTLPVSQGLSNAMNFIGPGAANTVLHGNGAAADPSFSGVSLTADTLAGQGTATTVLHGNAAGQPSFGAVALGTDVSGQLTVPNGGTGVNTLAIHGVVIGNAAGAVNVTAVGATHTLLHGNTGADPTYAAVDLTTEVGATILPVPNGGTGVATLTAHGVVVAEGAGAFAVTNVGSAGQVLKSNGAGADPTFQTLSGALIKQTIVSVTGNYTPQASCTSIIVEVWGAGGAGGSCASVAADYGAAGGGGGGGYARKRITGIAGAANAIAVTIGAAGAAGAAGNNPGGAGGTTSFDTGAVYTPTITAPGGSGGAGDTASAVTHVIAGGAGGAIGTNGDINLKGCPGGSGIAGTATDVSGDGGSGVAGCGAGNGVSGGAGVAGNLAAGGSGGAVTNGSGSVQGGAGGNGIVIVYEYT